MILRQIVLDELSAKMVVGIAMISLLSIFPFRFAVVPGILPLTTFFIFFQNLFFVYSFQKIVISGINRKQLSNLRNKN